MVQAASLVPDGRQNISNSIDELASPREPMLGTPLRALVSAQVGPNYCSRNGQLSVAPLGSGSHLEAGSLETLSSTSMLSQGRFLGRQELSLQQLRRLLCLPLHPWRSHRLAYLWHRSVTRAWSRQSQQLFLTDQRAPRESQLRTSQTEGRRRRKEFV
jgi:hypothetical protein